MKKRLGRLLTLFCTLAVVLVAGCNPQLQQEVSSLKKDAETLTNEVKDLREQLSKLEIQLNMHEFLQEAYKSAVFDPAADQGFQRVDSSVCSFAVSIEDVQPFADGSRVRISIGNLSAADVTDVKLKVEWGARIPKQGGRKLVDWQKSLQEKTIPLTERLRSGYWNRVAFTVPGTPPQQLGYLKLSMETGQIFLVKPP